MRTKFRFKVGDKVWVRDHVHPSKNKGLARSMGGFSIVQATVRERHQHIDRHPFYPNGEGYALDGELWWDCYPGCRVVATREDAVAARMGAIR